LQLQEHLLIDPMYDVPGSAIGTVTIDRDVVLGLSKPKYTPRAGWFVW
jgi:hypothetical protein